MLFQKGKNPVELERIFYPSLPWDLPQDQLERFIDAHSVYLKQLSDETYKIYLHVPGLGGGIDDLADLGCPAGISGQASCSGQGFPQGSSLPLPLNGGVRGVIAPKPPAVPALKQAPVPVKQAPVPVKQDL